MGFILLSVNLAALDPTFWNCTLNKEGKVPKGHRFFRFLWPYAKVNCSMAKTILAVSILRQVFQSLEGSEILDFR